MNVYQEAREKRKAALEPLISVLPPLLGPEWGNARFDKINEWMHRVAIDGPGGSQLLLETGDNGQRVSVWGTYPHPYQVYHADSNKPITVALSRGPEVLAREIKRRYLTRYLSRYLEACRIVKEKEEFESKMSDLTQRLATLMPGGYANGNSVHGQVPLGNELRVPDGLSYFPETLYFRVEMYGLEYGNLDLNNVPVGLVEEILKLLAAHRVLNEIEGG